MNDQDMEEALDFNTLSLDEPEERLQKVFEHAFHLNPSQNQNPSELSIHASTLLLEEIAKQEATVEGRAGSSSEPKETETPDNGPWAKLPTPGKIHPFLPGITAEKFDAMAMDPNHVFKSAQTPLSFSFTTPPSTSDTTSTAFTSEQGSVGSVARKGKTEDRVTNLEIRDDEIPEWMLEDPELVPQRGWNVTDTSDPPFTSRDFTLDWGSSDDISTMVDSNIIFGISSYPTYESLPISSVITEEQYRRSTGLDPPADDPSSPTSGGFAKYGQMGADALFFGYQSETNVTGVADTGPLQDSQSAAPNPISSSSPPKFDQQQWGTWRSAPGQVQDLDLDLDLDVSDAESPPFK